MISDQKHFDFVAVFSFSDVIQTRALPYTDDYNVEFETQMARIFKLSFVQLHGFILTVSLFNTMRTLLLLLALIHAFSDGVVDVHTSTFPQFIKRSDPSPHPKLIQLFSKTLVRWFSSWPTKLLVEVYHRNEFSSNLLCFVKRLKSEEALMKVTFCFRRKDWSVPECIILDEKWNYRNWIITKGLEARMSFNRLTGGYVHITDIREDVDVSLEFYCETENRRSKIRSNIVEIKDYRHLHKGEMFTPDEPKDQLNVNGPFILPCNRRPLKLSGEVITYTSTYSWFHCPVKSRHSCDYPAKFHWTEDSPAQLLPNGSLYFPFVTAAIKGQINHKYLFCTLDGFMHRSFRRPIEFFDGPFAKHVDTLTITHPSSDGMKIKLLNTDRTIVTYFCNYKAGRGKVSVKWKKYDANGVSIIISKTPNAIFNLQVKVVDFNGLRFYGPFNAATEGRYVCEVSWTPTQGPTIVRNASYFVSIKAFPQFSPDVPPVVLVYPGSNGTVECKFQQEVNISVRFNGHLLSWESQNSPHSNKTTFTKDNRSNEAALSYGSSALKQRFVNLNVSPFIHIFYPLGSTSIHYTAINMQDSFTGLSANEISSHEIECIGTNDVTYVSKSIVFLAVPTIKMFIPGHGGPAQCSKKHQMLEFKCIIKNIEQYRYLDYKVHVKQYWKIGKNYLHKDLKDVDISQDNTTLTIHREKIHKLAGQNQSSQITCVITMEYPPEIRESKDRIVGPFNTAVFYHSDHDTKMKNMLTYECNP